MGIACPLAPRPHPLVGTALCRPRSPPAPARRERCPHRSGVRHERNLPQANPTPPRRCNRVRTMHPGIALRAIVCCANRAANGRPYDGVRVGWTVRVAGGQWPPLRRGTCGMDGTLPSARSPTHSPVARAISPPFPVAQIYEIGRSKNHFPASSIFLEPKLWLDRPAGDCLLRKPDEQYP